MFKGWAPRDWRMLLAMIGLSVAGWGAWLLSKWSLDALVNLAITLSVIWPLAYFAYGVLGVLLFSSIAFAVVLGFKSFSLDLPGGVGSKIEGNNQ